METQLEHPGTGNNKANDHRETNTSSRWKLTQEYDDITSTAQSRLIVLTSKTLEPMFKIFFVRAHDFCCCWLLSVFNNILNTPKYYNNNAARNFHSCAPPIIIDCIVSENKQAAYQQIRIQFANVTEQTKNLMCCCCCWWLFGLLCCCWPVIGEQCAKSQ